MAKSAYLYRKKCQLVRPCELALLWTILFVIFLFVICKLDLAFCVQSNREQAVKKRATKSSPWQGLELQLLRDY